MSLDSIIKSIQSHKKEPNLNFELKRKTEGALQTILSIAGDPQLKELQLGTIWNLVET